MIQGKYSFNRRSLHAIGDEPNPYEQAISIIGRTLSPFDEDNLIPCFGFGDATTHEKYVFSFYPDHRPCHGFEGALARYREIAPRLKLSGVTSCISHQALFGTGPTSFAPVIDAAIDIVEESHGQYHVLVIIADGQVSRPSDLPPGSLSSQEQETIDAIVAASHCPLSIVLIGVGDGPWDAMHKFDDNIPQRAFDNFQFVNFTKIMSENMDVQKKEAAFALAALMEIPYQYRATQNFAFHKHDKTQSRPRNKPLPPPPEVRNHDKSVRSATNSTLSSVESNIPVEQACPICLTNPKDMAFGCGHLACKNCGPKLQTCPLCRRPITARVRLYA
ncbi:hypothetical protein Cgig2_015086 [Carnegiea gigantea]|uniref:RING-type domain-containing protein n=1 Tax=Carnegiea gigantea TaxID=171969 RepID=A0A9Q1KRU3_9CARY|nr:hypothetical protein Cgig2_015086 [Carnegiea gigantea]